MLKIFSSFYYSEERVVLVEKITLRVTYGKYWMLLCPSIKKTEDEKPQGFYYLMIWFSSQDQWLI